MLNRAQRFVIFFLVIGFCMKIVGEVVHEILGHGLFVILFGGIITDVKISLLWPYKLSWIHWQHNIDLTKNELIMIQAGGILICLLVSYALQSYLLLQSKLNTKISSLLFWISFWCYINATGYLIIGGLTPFGDVSRLINLGALTSFYSTFFGIILFLMGFFLLSKILRDILDHQINRPNRGVTFFWLIVPLIVIAVILGQGFQLYVLPISFLPPLFSFFWEFRLHRNV